MEGKEREEIMEDWRELHSEGLHDLYRSSCFVVMKWTWMRYAGHVARMGEKCIHNFDGES